MSAAPSFDEFFTAIHGFDPFPWQSRFAEQVVTAGWPAVVDAPTGLGKTSVIDVAIYRLALDAARPPAERVAHTRIALVVDRRLIVDAAHGHVGAIADAIETAADGPLAWARDQLRSIAGHPDHHPPLALDVLQMRGGLNWDSVWARSPTQPIMIAGTVDQIGSRVLFRGYGTSERMRPVDAGLLGSDTLVLLDEAHLSTAFAETLDACAELQRRAADNPVAGRHLQVVSMTATPVERTSPVVGDDDRQHPEARKRLEAEKVAHLVDVHDATAPARAAVDTGAVLARLARLALERDGVETVLVVANTVDAARATFDRLEQDGLECALVVGRCRPADRIERQRTWLPVVETGHGRDTGRSLVVVATQTVEVGVDIDVDALVTEAAPIDALVQRFGRVDRVGELGVTHSWIVRVPSRVSGDPPPYGPATQATWDWLADRAGGSEPVSVKSGGSLDGPTVDFGTLAMRTVLDEHAIGDDLTALVAPRERPPVVTPTTTRVWARTSPPPLPDEDVSGYLHGVERGQPQVSLFWRCDLPADSDGAGPLQLEIPPQRYELVEISLGAARRFLGGGDVTDTSDLESEPERPAKDRVPLFTSRLAYVKRNDSWVRVRRTGELRPGDVVAVTTDAGGHDRWSFSPLSAAAVTDVADLGPGLAMLETGSNAGAIVLRLNRVALQNLMGRDLAQSEIDLLAVAGNLDRDRADREGAVRALLTELATSLDVRSPFPEACRHLFDAVIQREFKLDGGLSSGPGSDVEHVTELVLTAGAPASRSSDEDDSSSDTLTAHDRVRLHAHLASVGDRCREFAASLGLSEPLARAVEIAGRFHDLGKADPRFQGMLTGGPRWMAESAGSDPAEMFAKSEQRRAEQRRDAQRASGWPIGYRHEAISLALAESAPDDAFAGTDRQLVEHLVATHHGCGRPLFPPVLDPESVEVKVDFDGVVMTALSDASHPGWTQPDRFDELVRRYGPWGLAWLETIVRLADISISKEGR